MNDASTRDSFGLKMCSFCLICVAEQIFFLTYSSTITTAAPGTPEELVHGLTRSVFESLRLVQKVIQAAGVSISSADPELTVTGIVALIDPSSKALWTSWQLPASKMELEAEMEKKFQLISPPGEGGT